MDFVLGILTGIALCLIYGQHAAKVCPGLEEVIHHLALLFSLVLSCLIAARLRDLIKKR